MEIGSVGAPNIGVLVSQSTTSDAFLSEVLGPLKSSFLYEESEQSFKYTSTLLIKNAQQERKYNAFREKKRELGYTDEDLKESFGFLLFSNINEAKKLGETGVLVGNSTCKTLGDPTKGVYISQYSDCLDQHPWSHGKSGYIVIIKLTKGRVKEVSEEYTQNVAAPTKGFDCHTCKEFSTVISNTSSFLAFQRTQCYLYEFRGDGNDETAQGPSAACVYAIVSFLYVDPKLTLVTAEYKSEHRELGRCYFPWTGQLHIGFRYYSVGLRATALIPAALPTVVKVDRVISLSDLRRVLPKAIFQKRFSSEVFLDGLYYSLCELVSSEVEQANTLNLLLQEIKAKDAALTVPLNDSGFLILLPSSYFCNNDSGSSAEEFLQGIFVFPESRLIHRDSFPPKEARRSLRVSPELLRVLPVPSYTESVAGETSVNPSEKLSEVFEQQLQNYTSVITSGMAASPKENGIISDRCQVPDTDSHLSSVPEWTNAAWQNFSSYLRKPDSFQIPVSKTSDILFPGQEKEVEGVVNSVSLCMFSPQEVPTSHVNLGSEGPLTSQNSAVNHSSVDGSTKGHPDIKTSPQSVKRGDMLIKTGDMETKTSPSSGDLRAELIVSITSAEPTVRGSDLVDTDSETKCNAFQPSGFQTKMRIGDEKDTAKKDGESTKKAYRGNSKGLKPPPKAHHELKHKHKDNGASHTSQLRTGINSSETQTRKFGKLSKKKKLKSATVSLNSAEEKKSELENAPMKLEIYSIRRKIEHWDLKPVISKCGRILVPHGSVNMFEQIKDLRNAAQSGNHMYCEKITAMSVNVNDTSKREQDAITEKAAATSAMDEDNQQQNMLSHVCPGHSILQQADDEIKALSLNPQSSGNESADALPSPECSSPENPARRMETLINKLKSVLRGKRNPDLCEEMTDNPENVELCLKRAKFETDLGSLKSAVEASRVPEAAAGKVGLSTLLSVDHHFAFALGLTPRKISNKMTKLEAVGVQQRKDPAETKAAAVSDGQQQIMQSPQSIIPQRSRIKMLRKHQGTSTENVKDKWWLHFQSPNRLESKGLGNKEDNPDRGTAEQRNSCFPTDGLNLLADLALCATSDQLPLQPEQAQERRLKHADVVAEQESVLHALLRQPAARPIQSLQSPPPIQNVGDGELTGLITKEHAYSMHPSTSLLLGFSSMPFQVYPLSGCTRLLYRHQTQSLAFDQEVKSNHQTPECAEIQTVEMKRFRHSRKFAIKDGSVQVTKRWKRNYDFGLDSKFSNDPQCRTICRALHGPWDFSVQDTSDEVRLIFHLWVALFYSRSMPRIFEFDSGPSCMETLPASVSTPPPNDLKNTSFAPELNVKDRADALISTPFDLTTNEIPIWDQRAVVLDLSKKNSHSDIAPSISQVIPMETCKTPNTPMELHTKTPFQCYRNVYTTEMIRKVNDIRSTCDSKTSSILQEHTSSCPETDGLRSSNVLRGRNNENTHAPLLDDRDKEASGVHEERNPSEEVSMELVPQLIQAGSISSGVVNNGDLFGKEKQLGVKEPEVFSTVKARDANEGMDCCPSEDLVGKDLNPKGDITSSYLSADLNDQQSQTMSASLESAENISVMENDHQSPEDFCFTDVRNHQLFQHDGQDMRNQSGSKADDSQQRKHVVDQPHYEEAALIMSNETTGLLDGSVPQTNTKIQAQCRTMVDLSCSLICDKTREETEMNQTQVNHTDECTQIEDAPQPHDPGPDVVVGEAECQKETPLTNDTASSRPADTEKVSCLQKGKPGLSDGRISPSLYDDRCPTPTLDEEPYRYTPRSGPTSSSISSSSIVGGETLKPASQKLKKLKPEMPHDKKSKGATAIQSDVNLPPSAPAVVKCKDKFLSAQNCTEEYSQVQIDDEKLCFQRGKPQTTSAVKSTRSSQSSCLSVACLQSFKPNTDKDGHSKPPQSSAEMPSCSQSLVTPANISKSDKTQGQSTSRDPKIENSMDLGTSGHSEKRTKNLQEQHKKGQIKGGTSERQAISLSNVNKSNSGRTNHLPADLLHEFKRSNTSELKRVVQIVGQEPRKCSELDQEHMDAPRSGVDYWDETLVDDAVFRGPQGSLRCTIFNSSQKRSSSFLEQMSKRCLQEDLTQASVEEECLIFSEQMKQVLKRSKEKSIHIRTPDKDEDLRLFHSISAAARSCSLHDEEGMAVRLDPSSFVGLKITVHMSDRTSQTGIKEEEISNSVKCDGVSGWRAGCARQDTGKMDDVCAGRKGPVRHKDARMDSGDPKIDLSDPCVKWESFPKNMKPAVKGCRQTKYRFYILVTSDDPCFDETKVQLEAQGHTAVQPTEFFHVEESSSTLLIILRNEDIAEHICEVPYLLSLKKSPGVQFAGIDEPDDVVNQTHQELFVRGGFIMFDRAALESLRLRDIKILSEILQELSRSGRWKWFLHYRHSRWLTEKSRLSGEAREKKNFISWCQEAGILEVLPYHECDRLSRDQPDYLTCLVRLQVQNVSARYPIFITEMTTNSSFGSNGILTLTLSSFLTCKTFPV